jgi:hypothetical protein
MFSPTAVVTAARPCGILKNTSGKSSQSLQVVTSDNAIWF